MCCIAGRSSGLDAVTHAWLLTAVAKIVAHQPDVWQGTGAGAAGAAGVETGAGMSGGVCEVFVKMQASPSTDVQQRSYEIVELVQVRSAAGGVGVVKCKCVYWTVGLNWFELV